jgi:pre-mRNA-processing factor 6
MKSAIVEREAGDAAAERSLLEEGLRRHPGFWKLWLMLGQLEERQGKLDAARTAYGAGAELSFGGAAGRCLGVGPRNGLRAEPATEAAARVSIPRPAPPPKSSLAPATKPPGIKRCPECVPLWRAAARAEEAAGAVGKARAVLEQARQRVPKRDDTAEARADLWLAAIRTEQRAAAPKAAEALLAKALQELPASGRLWAEAISAAPRPQRKTKSADALKRCDQVGRRRAGRGGAGA